MTVEMPSQVSGDKTAFDKFAGWCSNMVSRAPFFAFCVVLILVWAPTFAFLKFDTWQLIINTVTTIITFLMVALLQNTQTRNDLATQHKLNAIADALRTSWAISPLKSEKRSRRTSRNCATPSVWKRKSRPRRRAKRAPCAAARPILP